MDTHITHLDTETPLSQSARLPDEPDLAHFATLGEDLGPLRDSGEDSPATSPHTRPRKRRGRLLAGVAVGAIALCAASAFLVSPWNTTVPVPSVLRDAARSANYAFASLSAAGQKPPRTAIASSRHDQDPILAPAASVASINLPPRPATITKPVYVPSSSHQDLDQVLALGASKPTSPSAASVGQASSSQADPTISAVTSPATSTAGTTIHEPGEGSTPSLAKPASHARPDITTAVTEAALHPAASPSELPMPRVSVPTAAPEQEVLSTAHISAPSSIQSATAPASTQATMIPAPSHPNVTVVPAPVQVATIMPAAAEIERVTHLVAAPMTGHEQTVVLQAVTQLAKMVTNLKVENAALRKDVSGRMKEQDGRLADFDRRVSLAEARSALREAADVDKPAAPPPEAKPTPTLVSVSLAHTIPSPASPPAPVSAAQRTRYRVQAASPGLALLAEVGRGGGEGAQIQVAVGDQVPGWGVVKSVSQKGPNWVVLTDNGAIN